MHKRTAIKLYKFAPIPLDIFNIISRQTGCTKEGINCKKTDYATNHGTVIYAGHRSSFGDNIYTLYI